MWLYLNTSDQSRIAKSNPTAKASSCRECKKGICPKHQFGMIYEHYPKELSVNLSTLSSAGSHDHAKISVLQELEKAWMESEADFFSRSCAWPRKSSPSSYSLKTSLPSLGEGVFELLEKLPRWGMIVDGVLYPLHRLERFTKESAGSFWPTPKARDWKDNGESPSEQRRHSPSLPCRVKMIATPIASQAGKPIRAPSPSTINKTHGENIQDSIGRLNPEMIGKKLCPRWISVLMGYPTMWTDLRHLETP